MRGLFRQLRSSDFLVGEILNVSERSVVGESYHLV